MLYFDVYTIHDFGGGVLYWKGDEAYLFGGEGHFGYHSSYFALPFELLAEYFGASAPSKDDWSCSMVIHITPTNVEHFPGECGGLDVHGPHFLTPFDDEFFAMCQGSFICKWTGHGYVPATQDEQRRLGGTTVS